MKAMRYARSAHRAAPWWAAAVLVWLLVPADVAAQQVEPAILDALTWREIGPAVMGGRIADIAVNESDPAIFYVAVASGGLWRTTNHGTTWEPLFDEQPTASLGDVTLAPSNPNVIWVGTGEPQNRQSSPWGNGVYRSVDGGRTWDHLGLEETRHIGRIVVHPTDQDVAYVAAVGHLWGPNPERGVYRTTDGGRSWERVLYVDEHTGAIDLAMDPGDPNTLFAAMYQRRRTAWGFNGGGPGSGIYRTFDGGDTWVELTEGLPSVDMGRIGLDVYRQAGNLVYAIVEAPREQGRGVYRSVDRGETWEHLSETNPRPMYYSQIRVDPNDPQRIYVLGVDLHVSEDGGRTFHDEGARGVHSDHHALWIDPTNANHLILGSDGGVSASFDRADHWRMYDNLPIAQFYEVGVDMRDPYYVCGGLQDNGSWCGPSAAYERRGIRNADWYNINGGDGFYTRIDPNDHTVIFAESQNGYIARVDLETGERQYIRPLPEPTEEGEDPDDYRWNWNTPILLSVHDPTTIYAGANVLLKSTDRGYSWREVSPDLTKALDRRELEIMGVRGGEPALSRHDGVSAFGTLTTIAESPLDQQVVYVGTDDGNVQGTRDGGATWIDLTTRVPDLPERTHVSRVVASAHRVGTVYATFDGHYADDYAPYVYRSDDYGRNWRRITDGLPDWSVNIIAEHPDNERLLLVGNEVGVYVSIDRGEHWTRVPGNLPTVPVDDIAVHPRDNDVILGTHGRGIWILDDATPLAELTTEVLAAAAHLFSVRPATSFNPLFTQGWLPGAYAASNPPYGALIRYYLGEPIPAGEDEEPMVTLAVTDAAGDTVGVVEGPGGEGIQQTTWNLRLPPPFEIGEEEAEQFGFFGPPAGPKVLPGTYTVHLTVAGQTLTTELTVEGDPRVEIAEADLMERQRALLELYALAKPIFDASRAVRRLTQQVGTIRELLDQTPDVAEELQEVVDDLNRTLRRLDRDVNEARRDASRLFYMLDRVTARPTADQALQLDRVWEDATTAIQEVNATIAEDVPAAYDRLSEHGITPDIGEPIALPTRSGG
jgi:photosystem II stability/assembly factor-like uncharacterized protein